VVSCERGSEARQCGRVDTGNDICILDGSTSDTPLLVLTRQLQRLGWRRIMLVSTRHDVAGVRAALLTGVRCYLVTGNRWGLAGGNHQRVERLTDRELEVLQAVANGMSNKDIGAYLGLSSLTVKSHMARISRKMGTGDRARLVAMGMREGVIS
jgi:DNA-binding NarL/FixJ family response regulator